MKREILSCLFVICILTACSQPQPGPDKSGAGAVLGAAWGAGAGAIVGNQIGYSGEGVAVGAGLGLIQGLLVGANSDSLEQRQLAYEERLRDLQVQNDSNQMQIQALQHAFDTSSDIEAFQSLYQVYFDQNQTNLRAGSTEQLSRLVQSFKRIRRPYVINVLGHSDDSGTPSYNQRLSEARARSVRDLLVARGISNDQIRLESKGSTLPIASNSTQEGRQLNRRVDVYLAPWTPAPFVEPEEEQASDIYAQKE